MSDLPVQVVHEGVVHAHHVLGGITVSRTAATHHWGGVRLEQVKGVGAEGRRIFVVENLQSGRRQCGSDYLQLQEVLSTLQIDDFIQAPRLIFPRQFCLEDLSLGAVSSVSELIWEAEGNLQMKIMEALRGQTIIQNQLFGDEDRKADSVNDD